MGVVDMREEQKDVGATFEEYVKSLVGERVGITISCYKNDILGILQSVTFDKNGSIDGIIIDKWGWIRRSEVLRVNRIQQKN